MECKEKEVCINENIIYRKICRIKRNINKSLCTQNDE